MYNKSIYVAYFIANAFEYLFNTEMIPTEMLSLPFIVALILWKHPHKFMDLHLSSASSLDLVSKNEYINVFVVNNRK